MVYRRDLPGGRIVIISLDERERGRIIGQLRLERRADPTRRFIGEPPIVAEVVGATRVEVLAALRVIADNDTDIVQRLDLWATTARPERVTPPALQLAVPPSSSPSPSPSVVPEGAPRQRMADGHWWAVCRRHGMTQLAHARTAATVERPLYLLFERDDGTVRRALVPDDLPDLPMGEDLARIWASADLLTCPSPSPSPPPPPR